MAQTQELIQQAQEAYQQGNFAAAEPAIQALLDQEPGIAVLHYRLGICRANLGRITDARSCFRKAIQMQPTAVEFHCDLARTYIQEEDLPEARKIIDHAMSLNPDAEPALAMSVELFTLAGEHEQAMAQLEPKLKAGPISLRLAMALAELCPQFGIEAQGIAAIEPHLAEQQIPPAQRRIAMFRLGHLYDRLGQCDRAFACVDAANRMITPSYDPAAREQAIDQIIASWSAEALESAPTSSAHADEQRPVFIVGMPRSGSLLLEQILSCHPGVHAGGELPYMNEAVVLVSKAMGTDAQLNAWTLDEATGKYISSLAELAPEADRITDKLLFNYERLGLIQLMFPKARVIHCTREPVDTCLSCYFQPFTNAVPYAHRMEHMGHMHRQYQKLMNHWKSVLSISMLDVSYEELVQNPEGTVRQLLDFLELEFDEACLAPEKSTRRQVTGSTTRVNEPVDTKSVGRGKLYGSFIIELTDALKGQESQAMAWQQIPDSQSTISAIPFAGPGATTDDKLGQAEALIASEQLDQAILVLEPICRDEAENTQAGKLLGLSYLRASRLSDAANVLGPIVLADPGDHDARRNLAIAHLSGREVEKAELLLEEGLSQWPEALPLILAKAHVLAATKRVTEALAVLQPLIDSGHTPPEAADLYGSLRGLL